MSARGDGTPSTPASEWNFILMGGGGRKYFYLLSEVGKGKGRGTSECCYSSVYPGGRGRMARVGIGRGGVGWG